MKVDFYFEHKGLTHHESFDFPNDQTMTAQELEAMRQERLQLWIASLDNEQTED
jgi:hypothetical protein